METKTCIKCTTKKPLTDFGVRYGKPQSYCRECNRAYQRQHYKQHKDKYKQDCLERRWQIRYNAIKFVMEYAKDGCSKCPEKDFFVLEFDHIDRTTKRYTISGLVSRGASIQRIKEELNKCQILCANCHRKRTAKQMNWYKSVFEHTGNIHEYTKG